MIANPENYKDILNAVLTFSGTVLAIFFTLIVLPIQNILGRYSQDLVKRLINSPIFIGSFIFLIITFIYNLGVLYFGATHLLISFSVGSGIDSLLVLALIVIHTFYLLDIRNQITDIVNKTKRQIKSKIRKYEQQKKSGIEKLNLLISANRTEYYTKFEVGNSVIDWLKADMEIVIDVAQKAISENRFEIVDSCLLNTSTLAKEYLNSRKDYGTQQDAFIGYLHEKLIDTKSLVGKNTHPKIMLSIINTAKDISIESLKLKPIRAQFGENFIPHGLVNLLKDICLSSEILKDTSYAPMSACDSLVSIGASAIDHEFPRTADTVISNLSEISKKTTKAHFFYGDYVSAKANWGLAYLLDYALSRMDKIKIDRDIFLKSIAEEINKSIKVYFEDDYDYLMRSNIKTFCGLLSENGVATIFVRALLQPKDEEEYSYVLDVLKDFLQELNQNVIIGMNRAKLLDVAEILEHVYTVSIVLIGFIKRVKNPRQKENALEILHHEISNIFITPISMSFKKSERHHIPFKKYIESYFSLIGIMLYENKNGEFTEIIENCLSKTIEVVIANKTKIYTIQGENKVKNYEVIHPLIALYQCVALSGSWLNKYRPGSKILVKIIQEVKNQSLETIVTDHFSRQKQTYPESVLNGRWFIKRPLLTFDTQYFSDIDKELYDIGEMSKFEAIIK